jgi:hypothetical protein
MVWVNGFRLLPPTRSPTTRTSSSASNGQSARTDVARWVTDMRETRASSPICDSGVMVPRRLECDGYVSSLLNQRVLCTGKTYVDGEWRKRPDLYRAIRGRGGWPVEGTRNANVTLLVVGDLPGFVTDPVNHRSQNLVYAEDQRLKGNHVCIVDDSGITALLRGDAAPCLRSRAVGPGLIELSLPIPRQPSRPRLVPLNLFDSPHHDPTGLELDLSGLDAGTAAHHKTLTLLTVALAPTVAQGLSQPKVDAAWRCRADSAVLVIAEVKSLTGAHQAQQIRLGIGQVLDYAVTLRADPPDGVETIRPVLALETEPDNPEKWVSVAAAGGIALTWAPAFAGMPC